MTKFTTTIDFIHVCNEQKRSRFDSLVKLLGLDLSKLSPFRDDIDNILDFIKHVDESCHMYADDYEAFNQTFHLGISSDLRSLIILAATHQNFQMNIILRHFIEVFIVSLWIDIGSQFTGGFDYFLESRKWKPHMKHYRIFWDNDKNPVRSIKQRLNRIKMLNSSRGCGTRFYKSYLLDASETDLRLLLSLSICDECKAKQKKDDFKGTYSRYHVTSNVTKKGKEDKKAKYKTDFRLTCNFCYKQKPTKSYAMGVPDIG